MEVGETCPRTRPARDGAAPARIAAAGAALAHAQAPPATPLRDGESQNAAQHATDRFSYDVEVGEPGTYLLRVEQRGLDLIVSVETPAGLGHLLQFPAVSRRQRIRGPRLRPRPVPRRSALRGAHGRGRRPCDRGDALRAGADARELEAWQLVSAAGAANFAAGDRGWARAVEAYEHAAALWQELGRAREEADAWFGAATIRYWQLFEWNPAAERAARAAGALRQPGRSGARGERAPLAGRLARRASARDEAVGTGDGDHAGVRGVVRGSAAASSSRHAALTNGSATSTTSLSS